MRRVFFIETPLEPPVEQRLRDGDPVDVMAPLDLEDGELIEAIRLGGPRDGETLGYFRGGLTDWGNGLELDMLPVEECTAESAA